MQTVKKIYDSFFHLLYPHICTGCGSDLLSKDNQLCAKCMTALPYTHYAMHEGNPVEKIFGGRLPIAAAHSQFYFEKTSLMQHLVHQLKYKGNTSIGIYLGELLGKTLSVSHRFQQIDALIPLPLYPEKEKKRGYNQAAIICQGISAVLRIPIINNNLIRRRYTDTQTKKHRTERWENVADSFIVRDSEALCGKHLLLVDDVITTGATLEAGGAALMQAKDTKLSIATLTIATL
ncbi:MAG TPA: phosphoribosyltransferase family protein [Ferruginibacter sp.]|nr:phosphoribosyltransferase family protein [Ferruginibacter sp.]HMP19465.1 phosphoribosyltransferase family protein [Ferruginibacter sp.]